ncbi:glycoside hydrolase family 13 protein [Bifidobacterium myosotis]|uniref:Glycoside hydrolase family 13 protein n=1 Tax=Bifidobacterium myosotis TaxID=1630166 RepID=A0A5M9ZGJ1_9BIFI|nr:glycoside hydrolase family 13 protein [Bifidobacterium myosotis]KAA8825827.1 glycoside hydrolase family 13 protein [Bifidobacterium myosotis]MCH4845885.1 glycoside hydrolase family 13 protein [Bifidobacterium longum]
MQYEREGSVVYNKKLFLQGPLAHHDGSPLYVDNARPCIDDIVNLSIRISHMFPVKQVFIRVVVDGEPHYTQAHIVHDNPEESWWTGSIKIWNTLTSYRFLLVTEHGNIWLNGLGLYSYDIPDSHDFRLSTFHVPEWVQNAVIYQIFPDRFACSTVHPIEGQPDWAIPVTWDTPVAAHTPDAVRQMYGGSLWGIAEHLDYIKNLGANVIYLTPFFPAESNHRYDAATFDHVDPFLGGDEALHYLIDCAHHIGIRIIGDLTLNHSGATHDWFVTGQHDPNSQEAGFYYFDQDDRASYATFDGVKTLPKFDHRSHELQRRLYAGAQSVVARYIQDFGLDGWRIDVAQSAGIYRDINLNENVAEQTRSTMETADTDTLLIAEHQFDASQTLQGPGWHGTMSYAAFTKPTWAWLGRHHPSSEWGAPGVPAHYGGEAMVKSMQAFTTLVPWQSCLASMNLLDSHDTSRFRSIAGTFQALGIALQMTLPGIPSIFSGDEVGLEGRGLEEGRQPFPWNPDHWDHSVYELYRLLITLRHNHKALQDGGLRWYRHDDDTIIFERADKTETLIIEISRKHHAPLISTVNAESLTDGDDLKKGSPMPSSGPAFHIWQVHD